MLPGKYVSATFPAPELGHRAGDRARQCKYLHIRIWKKDFGRLINMFLIKFEQQAVCLWKKKHVSKEENIIVTASDLLQRARVGSFFP